MEHYANVTSTNQPLHDSTSPFAENPNLIGRCQWTALNTALALFLLLSFLLNAGAAVVVFRVPLVSDRGKSNPIHLCIRFLNVIDLIQSLALLVMPLFADVDCEWWGGDYSCKIWGFFALFLLLVSPLITITMAIDRVLALYLPIKYRGNLGLQALKVLLPTFCGITLLICVFPLVGIGEYHVVRGRRLCLLDTITDDLVDGIYVITVHSVFLLALFVMIGCTVTFQVKLISLSKKRSKSTASQSTTSLRTRQTRNATVTTMAVCIIFVVCYCPYVIRVILEASTGIKSRAWITMFSFILAFLQPMLNPIVCLCTNAKYRTELQIIFRQMKRLEYVSSSENVSPNSRASSSDPKRHQTLLNFKNRKKSAAHPEASSSSGHYANLDTRSRNSRCANVQ